MDLEYYIPRAWIDALNTHPNPEEWRGAISRLNTCLQARDDAGNRYHPKGENIFKAFHMTCFCEVRVVIVGQDPYEKETKATGLAFSQPKEYLNRYRDSLTIIYETIIDGAEIEMPAHRNLDHWAKQGVFLLNRVLTFHTGNNTPNRDWKIFTKAVLQVLENRRRPLIHFMLWGRPAQSIKDLIGIPKRRAYEAPHPSPLNTVNVTKFKRRRHFSRVNAALVAQGERPINWFPPAE